MSERLCLEGSPEQYRSSSAGCHSSHLAPELLPPLHSLRGDSYPAGAQSLLRVASASSICLASVTTEYSNAVDDPCGPDAGSSQGYDAASRTMLDRSSALAVVTSSSSGQLPLLVIGRSGWVNGGDADSSEVATRSVLEVWGYNDGRLRTRAEDTSQAAVGADCEDEIFGARQALCHCDMIASALQADAPCSSILTTRFADAPSRDRFESCIVVDGCCCDSANSERREEAIEAGRKECEQKETESENDGEQGGGRSTRATAGTDSRSLMIASGTAVRRTAQNCWPLGNLHDAFCGGTVLSEALFCQLSDERDTKRDWLQPKKSDELLPKSHKLLRSRARGFPGNGMQQNAEQCLATSWPALRRLDCDPAAMRAYSTPELRALRQLEHSSAESDFDIFDLELETVALLPKQLPSARPSHPSQTLPDSRAAERPKEFLEAEIWKFVQNMQAYRNLVVAETEGQFMESGNVERGVFANARLLPGKKTDISSSGSSSSSSCSYCCCSTCPRSASASCQKCTLAAAEVDRVGSEECCSSDDKNCGGGGGGGGSTSAGNKSDGNSDGVGDAWQLLPDELWLHVFSYLSPAELCRGPAVACRRWRHLCADPSLWTALEFSLGSPVAPHQLCYVASRAPWLRKLSLQGREQLLPTELAVIGQLCPSLAELDLGFCDVGLAAMHAMVNCGGFLCLSSLNVEGSSGVNMDFVQLLCSLPSLTAINLSHCHVITDLEMIYLAHHVSALTELNADGLSFITDDAVEELVQCHGHRLTSLHLDGAELTDCSTRVVSWSCPKLVHFRVSFCEQLSDESLQSVQNLTLLKSLVLRKGSLFSSAALRRMFGSDFRLDQLLYLDLSECVGLDDLALQSLSRSCPRLTELHLRWCWEVSEAGLDALVANCRSLRVLDLLGIDKITGDCFRNLPSLLPSLRLLDLSQCNRIVDDIIQDVVKRVPGVQVINYYGELFKV